MPERGLDLWSFIAYLDFVTGIMISCNSRFEADGSGY